MLKIKEQYFWILIAFSLLISFSITTKKFSLEPSSCENLKKILIKDDCIKQGLFTPKDNVKGILCDLIINEKKQMRIAIYLLTDKHIANSLIQAKKDNNVDIEVITCASNLDNINSKIWQLYENGITIFIFDAPKKSKKKNRNCFRPIMHNKFFIFDRNIDDKNILWTGSFNCTLSAQTNNKENVIVLEDKYLVDTYKKEFEELKKISRTIEHYKHKKPIIEDSKEESLLDWSKKLSKHI